MMTLLEQSQMRLLVGAAAVVVAGSPVWGEVPTYRVDVVATYSVTTSLRGASDAGHLVGDQIIAGFSTPFVATVADGLQHLPLPQGYNSGTALGVNDAGVVVGAVDDSGFPFDLGEPAIWTPDGSGGYTVTIPQQFTTVDSPLGPLGVNGGMCVDVNDNGTVVGWSRYQGFQGGPTTIFSTSAAPVNLQPLGFEATVEAINDNDVACGGQIIFDITNNTATDIGVPDPIQPGNVSFTDAIAFAINDSNETVVAANLASVPTENYLTYTHNAADGYTRVNPAELPARFVGFYDNNDLGDVASSGGLLFDAEGVLETNIDNLIDPAFSEWDAEIGFIDNDRRISTTAFNTGSNENALILLVPITGPCPADIDGSGVLDDADLALFVTLADAGDQAADYDGSGTVDFFDVVALLRDFDAGCP
jgi:hypothetical protein